ncbi:hypothetical protein EPO44_10180 [bacterium]|nr:MAG: hypothetical protein EPO44_10180 [bacterium]
MDSTLLQPLPNDWAPAWMFSADLFGETPAGFEDHLFQYSVRAAIVITLGVATPQLGLPIQVDRDVEGSFFLLRLLTFHNRLAGATLGTAVARLVDPCGDAMMNGFVRLLDIAAPDLALTTGLGAGVVWPEMVCPGGSILTADLSEVDAAGTGTGTITLVLTGVRRRPKT